jgi:hypothetical protein
MQAIYGQEVMSQTPLRQAILEIWRTPPSVARREMPVFMPALLGAIA